MVSLQRLVFMAALSMVIAVAALASLGWAGQPCPPPTTLPVSAPEALPGLIDANVLQPITEQMQLGLDVLNQVENRAKEWRGLKDQIVDKIDKIVPLEGQPSGGVRQLHPLRGTFLIRKDYAQQTLEEDWFLKPSLGTAALHLDVPYDADVTVTPCEFKEGTFALVEDRERWIRLHSRGRYRHLVLGGLSDSQERPVRVRAELRREPPKGVTYVPKTKEVYLLAGDRRHLAFSEDDFRKVDTTLPRFVASVAASATTTTRSTSRKVEKEGFFFRNPEGDPDGDDLKNLKATVKFDDNGEVESLDKQAPWPDELAIVHRHGYPRCLMPPSRPGRVALKIQFFKDGRPLVDVPRLQRIITNWDIKDSAEDVRVAYPRPGVAGDAEGVGGLPFKGSGDDLWVNLSKHLHALTRDDISGLKVVLTGYVRFADPNSSVIQIIRIENPLELTITEREEK